MPTSVLLVWSLPQVVGIVNYCCNTFFLGFALLVFPYVLSHSHAVLSGLKLGMMARVVMTSAIYQKVM